jgi:RimJ/RimL family protein N-acetyltransferase
LLDGALVGFQSLGRMKELPEGWGDIATFAAEGLTGRGIGSALFAATRAKALALGLHRINARIRADNTGGLTYYSRMGFVDYHVDRAVPLADGTPVDRVFKQLAL